MTKGTLRMLVHRAEPYTKRRLPALVLRWTEPPPSASFDDTLDDVFWGDERCGPPTDVPNDAGLWLLVWDWTDEEDDDTQYYDTCDWRRPTLADLIALGALPEEPDHA